MKIYARFVLWLLRPALELQREQERREQIFAMARTEQTLRELSSIDLSRVTCER